jgi:23S rRNA pseudouridine1911/1915/1917 synthase
VCELDPLAEYLVHEHDPRLRIDRMAAERFGLPSRSQARKMIKRGELLLDGQPVEPSRFVKVGDRLQLLRPAKPPPTWELELTVVYADDDLAAVLKPPGPVVSGNRHRTVEHALPFNLGPSSAPDPLVLPRPVHRLDARTSGLLLVARSASALVELGRRFQRREVHKRYRAILSGRLEGEGVVDTPIEDREARTRWRVVRHDPSLHVGQVTTVDLFPETGRTHQLRRHMASLGHPVLGDDLYTDGPVLRSAGLFLFAAELSLLHPRTDAPLHLELPEPAKYETFRAREVRRYARVNEPAIDPVVPR